MTQLNSDITKVEKIDMILVQNDNYEIITENYPIYYKNGFIIGSLLVKCISPSSKYIISVNLPNRYYVDDGVIVYWHEEEISGNINIKRINLYSSGSQIGINGGEAGHNYNGLLVLPCKKSMADA